jgi:biopolymer transport protein ExbD
MFFVNQPSIGLLQREELRGPWVLADETIIGILSCQSRSSNRLAGLDPESVDVANDQFTHATKRCGAVHSLARAGSKNARLVSNPGEMLQSRRSKQAMAKFDSTAITFALLGIVLTLLIVSLVTGPPFHCGGPDLARVAHPIAMRSADRSNALRIAIARDGRFYFGNDQTDETHIVQDLKIRLSRGVERKLYIEADSRVRYRAVSIVLDAAQSAGISQIAFLVEQRKNI